MCVGGVGERLEMRSCVRSFRLVYLIQSMYSLQQLGLAQPMPLEAVLNVKHLKRDKLRVRERATRERHRLRASPRPFLNLYVFRVGLLGLAGDDGGFNGCGEEIEIEHGGFS